MNDLDRIFRISSKNEKCIATQEGYTIEYKESKPFNVLDMIGTPITGQGTCAANTPGKCAAPPAPAIITFTFLCFKLFAYSIDASGHL